MTGQDVRVTSVANPKVKEARALLQRRQRARSGKVLLEGLRLVDDALQAGVSCVTAFFTEEAGATAHGAELLNRLRRDCPVVLQVTDEVFATLADTETPQGIALVAEWRPPSLDALLQAPTQEERPLLLVADAIRDPGNLGTMVRTAAAAGSNGVITTRGSVDVTSPKSLRASMGAAFRIPCVSGVDPRRLVEELGKVGIRLIVADPGATATVYDTDWRCALALVVGSEATGPAPVLLNAADQRVRLPMATGMDSLNAAMTASVCLYEGVRQRRKPASHALHSDA